MLTSWNTGGAKLDEPTLRLNIENGSLAPRIELQLICGGGFCGDVSVGIREVDLARSCNSEVQQELKRLTKTEPGQMPTNLSQSEQNLVP